MYPLPMSPAYNKTFNMIKIHQVRIEADALNYLLFKIGTPRCQSRSHVVCRVDRVFASQQASRYMSGSVGSWDPVGEAIPLPVGSSHWWRGREACMGRAMVTITCVLQTQCLLFITVPPADDGFSHQFSSSVKGLFSFS